MAGKKFYPVIFIVMMLAAGCAAGPEAARETATPTATATREAATQTPTRTATTPTATATDEMATAEETAPAPTPDLSGTPIPRLRAGEEVTITRIEMMDVENGWAIGGRRDPGVHVLRTTDGGETWRDVTPPEPMSIGEEADKRATAYFYDTNTAWVTFHLGHSFSAPVSPVVWFTGDGGESWAARGFLDTRDLPEFFNVDFFTFLDRRHGWLLAHVGSGMSHDFFALYRTSDGGDSWTRIVDPYLDNAPQFNGKNGLAFGDSQTGLLTIDSWVMEGIFVYWTYNGGDFWEEQVLPFDEAVEGSWDYPPFCSTFSPRMEAPEAAWVGVNCRTYVGEEFREFNYIYSTEDGGLSWTLTPYPGGDLTFIDASVGWATGLDIYQTVDGGSSWALMNTVGWEGQFSLVDESNGWAVARDREEGQVALVRTSDGGRTWEIIEAVVGD